MQLNITENEFIELYNTLTYVQLSKKLGLSRNRIANLVKELGLSKPVGRKRERVVFKDETAHDR